MDAEWLENLIEDAGYEPVRDYTGIGMGRKQCVGIIAPEGARGLAVLADLIRECDDVSDAAGLVRACRIRDTGANIIILYWPRAVTNKEEG